MRTPVYETRLARSAQDIRRAKSLRYEVFIRELGGDGPLVDHSGALEQDRFDEFAEQLILLDVARPADDRVVGVYRLMDQEAADAAGQYYSEGEFDLDVLRRSGRRLLECGRSCLHPDYRGGAAMMHLWQALAEEVRLREIDVVFGVASFHGCDVGKFAQPLTVLARNHLAPADLRVRSKTYQTMALCDKIERVAAMKQMPALIKAYLRLGGFVGDGAFVDRAFNTVDVCLMLDIARLADRQRSIYGGDV